MSRLEDSGVVTDCSLKTQESEETLDFNFNSANVINKIIIKVTTLLRTRMLLMNASDSGVLIGLSVVVIVLAVVGWL